MKNATRRTVCTYALVLPWATRAQPSAASPRSMQLIVPAPPGTQPDLLARALVEPMSQRAGLPGIVVNRPGAAGAIAVDAALSASAESGPLLLAGLDHVAYSHLDNARRALDPFVDVVPVAVVNRDTWLLVVSASGPHDSLQALVASAGRDGGVAYATGGEGTTAHLLSARLVRALGVEAVHVPYKDAILPDLIAGRVQFALMPTPAALPHVRGGRLRALATLNDERLPQLEAVPTVRELGLPEQVFTGGLFLFAPGPLSAWAPAVNGWVRDAVARPQVAARFRDLGVEPVSADPEQTRSAVADRLRRVDAMRIAVFGRAR